MRAVMHACVRHDRRQTAPPLVARGDDLIDELLQTIAMPCSDPSQRILLLHCVVEGLWKAFGDRYPYLSHDDGGPLLLFLMH
eukprot:gene26784-65835_t